MHTSRCLRALIVAAAFCGLSLVTHAPSRAADDPLKKLCAKDAVAPGLTPPVGIAKPRPSYPPGESIRESEGWALLGYTIGADGATTDIVVLDRMGSQHVLKASTDALASWRYRPALLNGHATAQYGNALSVLYIFGDKDARSVVHDIFTEKYKYGRALLRNKKPREAVAALESAFDKPLVLHEQTMLSFALAIAHRNLGDGPRALQHIRHATIEDAGFLDKKAVPAARRLQLVLEAQDGNFQYVACWSPFADVSAGADDDAAGTDVARIVANVKAALASPAPLVLEAKLATSPWVEGTAMWQHPLLRRKFAFDTIAGGVKNLRLTCDTQIVDSPVNETTQWSIPESAGSCVLRVYGDAGASFRLIEEW